MSKLGYNMNGYPESEHVYLGKSSICVFTIFPRRQIHSNCERKPCPLWAGRNRAKDKFLIFLQTKQVAMSIIPNSHYSEDDFESETHNGRGSA